VRVGTNTFCTHNSLAVVCGHRHLLQRDFDLAWAGTNAHFVAGMWGFMLLIGLRSYFQAGCGLLGRSIAGLAFSGLMLTIAIVNRGVAAGSGDGLGYGGTVLHLIGHYVALLFKQATKPGSIGPLELAAMLGVTFYSVQAARGIWMGIENDAKIT
jgi:hypothetical protein